MRYTGQITHATCQTNMLCKRIHGRPQLHSSRGEVLRQCSLAERVPCSECSRVAQRASRGLGGGGTAAAGASVRRAAGLYCCKMPKK